MNIYAMLYLFFLTFCLTGGLTDLKDGFKAQQPPDAVFLLTDGRIVTYYRNCELEPEEQELFDLLEDTEEE